jgi:hypothetical protein
MRSNLNNSLQPSHFQIIKPLLLANDHFAQTFPQRNLSSMLQGMERFMLRIQLLMYVTSTSVTRCFDSNVHLIEAGLLLSSKGKAEQVVATISVGMVEVLRLE